MNPRRLIAAALVALALAAAAAHADSPQAAAVERTAIIVNTTGDAPDLDPADDRCDTGAVIAATGAPECSLRAAIAQAAAAPGPDTVEIAIAAWDFRGGATDGTVRLAPATALPTVTEELVIDGGGAASAPVLAPARVVLDGAPLLGATALRATAPTTLRSVTLQDFAVVGPVTVSDPPATPGGGDTAPTPDPSVAPGPATPPPAAPVTPAPAADPVTAPAEPPAAEPSQPEPSPPPGPSPSRPSPAPEPPTPHDPGDDTLGVAAVVNSTGDATDIAPGDGVCSTGAPVSAREEECTLRAALEEANAGELIDTVVVDIPRRDFGRGGASGPTWVVRLTGPLPAIDTPMTIDAVSQPGTVCAPAGASPAPAVVIDANGAPVGLRIRAGGVVVRGLGIDGAATAVRIEGGAGGNTLVCNRLGVDRAGAAPTDGLVTAVHIDRSPDNRVGGLAPGDANLLGSGSRGSVRITGAAATGTTVIGNTVVGGGPPLVATAGATAAAPEITAAESLDGRTTLTVVPNVAPGAYRLEVLGVGETATTPVAERRVAVTGAPDALTTSIPDPDADMLMATLTADPAGPGLAATSAPSGVYAALSVSQIRGTVYEDVDGDGSVGDDGTGVGGVDVRVFSDAGNGVPDAGDAVIAATRTDGSGSWSVEVPADGLYWAAIDSRDVVPAAGVRAGFSADDVWAEQTYAAAGAVRLDGSSVAYTATAGALPGGKGAAAGDGYPVLSDAEHVMRVSVAGADVTGVDTGFSFAAVTNTLDDPSGGAFDDPASWASFDGDAAGIGVNPEGFAGSVYDGRYVYFSPSQRTGGRHGEVLRYDTRGAYTSAASWDSFDAGDAGVGSDPDGYAGAVFDGRYVYFAPDHNGAGRHGEVLRYDTEGAFGAAGSWRAYDPGDSGVGADPDGYSGAEFDGRYLYFAPLDNGQGAHGEVLRYDTRAPFAGPAGWSTFDPGANGVGTDPDGYGDVLFDGRHLYFAPLDNGAGAHGEVLRYDVRQPFASPSSWTTYDPGAAGVGTDPDGFSALVSDGRHLYLIPSDAGSGPSGEVVRLDTTAPFDSSSSWTTFAPGAAGLGAGAVGFSAASFDGRSIYLVQGRDGSGPAGRVVRYDTRASFGSVSSWSLFDPVAAGVGTEPDGARSAVFDGRYLYVGHGNGSSGFSGEVLRLDTARAGQGSLRRLVTNANAIAGTQASSFAIPTSDPGYAASPAGFTISPSAPLPAVVDPLVLDASTQAQSAALGRPVVAIDGAAAGAGAGITLDAGSDGSEIRGLAVGGFPGAGIVSASDATTIAGAWVGIGLDGTTPAPNGGVGIRIDGDGTTVGGTAAIDRNVVSGNGDDGVRLAGAGATVIGNRIGTDAAGGAAVTGGEDGVDVRGAGSRIGGPLAGEGNVISGNADEGVSLSAGADGTVVQGNRIGVGADGSTAVPNGDLGVWVNTSSNRIGGTATGAGNTISSNTRAGVLVNGTAVDNAILGNGMEGNGGLGIDLNATAITSSAPSDGVTPNDAGDADTGGNDLLNTPELGPMIETGGVTEAPIDLDVPAGTYRLEFFVNPGGGDPSGSGEGGSPAGVATVTHAGGGVQTFTRTVPVSAGDVVTATVTSANGSGSTSELSAPVTVLAGNDAPVIAIPAAATITEDVPLTFSAGTAREMSVNDADAGGADLAVTLTAANGRITLGGTTGLVFTDGDGDGDPTTSFTGTLTAINAALDGAVFTPDAEFAGAAALRLDIDDGGNTGVGGPMTDTATIAITVVGENDAPVQTLPSSRTTAEDVPLTLSSGDGTAISIADADAGAAAVSVTLTAANATVTLAGTDHLTFGSGDGTADTTTSFSGALIDVNAALDGLVVTPAADFSGTSSVRVVTDDLGASGPGGARTDDDTLAIAVTPVNDPPLNVVPATQTVSGGTPLTLSTGGGNAIGVTDVNSGSGALRVSLATTTGSLSLDGTTGLSFVVGDGSLDATMTFSGTRADIAAALDGAILLPPSGASGTATIGLDSDDQGHTGAGGALTDSDTFDVTVTPAASPPVLAPIGSRTIAEGSTLALTASATDPDLPADTLTYSLVGAPTGAAMDPATGAFSWTPTEAQGPGTYSFAVVVTDAGSPRASDSETVTVQVTEVNARPALDPIADRANGEGDPVSVSLTGVDPDVPADTLTWSATGLPPGLAMDPATGAISGVVQAGAVAGSPYPVTVTLRDAAGESATESFTWTIALTNSAPVMRPLPAVTGDEMTPITASAAATDPDGDAIRYSLRDAPAGARIDPATGVVTWTPTEAQGPDRVTIDVVATDDGSPVMSAERPLVVTVREVNQRPALDAPDDVTVVAGAPLTVATTASDPDRPRNELSFAISGPGGMTVDDAGVIRWTPSALDVGEHDATVTVTDDGAPAESAARRLHVTVTAAPTSPGGAPAPGAGRAPGGRTPPAAAPAPAQPPRPPSPTAPAPARPPAAPAPAPAPGGLSEAQIAARRLGADLLVVAPTRPRAGAGERARVGVSLTTPVKVIGAAADLSVPVRLLSMGGAWIGLIGSVIVMRRRNRRPLMVKGIDAGDVLPVMPKRSTEGAPLFLLRHDAGPVWSIGAPRRRRGRKWIEVETPLGPGFADAGHLADPPRSRNTTN